MADQQKTLQDFFEEEKAKLDQNERQRAEMKKPANDDRPTPRPSDSFIDRHFGPKLSDQQINDKAHAKAWARLKDQDARNELREAIEKRNKEREASLSKENKAKDEPSKDKTSPTKAEDWAKEEIKKREQEKSRDKDDGLEL